MTFLITEYDKLFAANGFGTKFKDWSSGLLGARRPQDDFDSARGS